APGPDSEHAENLAADIKPVCTSQIAPLAHTHIVGAPGEHAGEGIMALPDLLPHRSRQLPIRAGIDAHAAIAAHNPHFGEFVRVWDWQAAQPDSIEQLKDGGIRADT